MQRSINPIGLLLTSVSAIIGSGWLFSSFYSAQLAGPAAILSWVIGGAAVVCVAFVFAELCALLPISGSSTRIPLFTHGTLVSFLFSWIIWLSYVALTPTEVQAMLQYASFYFPHLISASGGLSAKGYFAATILMLVASTINIYSIRWLIRFNNLLTLIKLLIPIFISLLLILLYFTPNKLIDPSSAVGKSSFMPFGLHGVVQALALGGIIFAFNGFKQAAEMAGEANRPHFTVPFAIIGSVIVCLIVFLLLQTSFLESLLPVNLSNGWGNISIQGSNGTSPFASILYEHHLYWILPLLYFGAIVAPFAAGLMYVGSSARALYGISKSGQLPTHLQLINVHGNPTYSIIINFAVGMLMFAPLPGWNKMVAFLTSLLAITYGIGPITLLALRYQLPHKQRLFKLPVAKLWTTAAFCICNLLAYWSGWAIISKLSIALALGIVILFVYRGLSRSRAKLKTSLHLRESVWIWPYFLGLTLISYLGNFGEGKGLIKFGWDFAIIMLFSIAIMWLAIKFRLPDHETERLVAEHVN